MVREIELEEYFLSDTEYVFLDTRTPAEYEKAHMPRAKNLPLLDNEERAKIGTTYKQVGREEAILQGFDLTGHKWRGFIEQALGNYSTCKQTVFFSTMIWSKSAYRWYF